MALISEKVLLLIMAKNLEDFHPKMVRINQSHKFLGSFAEMLKKLGIHHTMLKLWTKASTIERLCKINFI